MPRSRLITVIETVQDDGQVQYSLEDGTPIGSVDVKKNPKSSLVTPNSPEKVRDKAQRDIERSMTPDAILARHRGEE